MLEILKNKELRGYLGAATVFILIMGLLLFLAFFEIPETNNDIFKVIVGMLVGSLGVVIYTFIGKNPEEVAQLEAKLEAALATCDSAVKEQSATKLASQKEKDALEKLLRDLQNEVIDKLAVAGHNFQFSSLAIETDKDKESE
jgi:cytochrome c biogenesis protein CcdA|tara:strand:+ start:2136 stop:2564 length:429 start_codon:yes stop_codon:yes gene_type:complete